MTCRVTKKVAKGGYIARQRKKDDIQNIKKFGRVRGLGCLTENRGKGGIDHGQKHALAE